jgi:hypothetical protein
MKERSVEFSIGNLPVVLSRGDEGVTLIGSQAVQDEMYGVLRAALVALEESGTSSTGNEVPSVTALASGPKVSPKPVRVAGVPMPVDAAALEDVNVDPDAVARLEGLIQKAEAVARAGGMEVPSVPMADIQQVAPTPTSAPAVSSESSGTIRIADPVADAKDLLNEHAKVKNKRQGKQRMTSREAKSQVAWKPGMSFEGERKIVYAVLHEDIGHEWGAAWELTLDNGDVATTDLLGKTLQYELAPPDHLDAPVTVAPDASDDEIAAALIKNTRRNVPEQPKSTILPAWTPAEKIAEQKANEDLFHAHEPPEDLLSNHKASRVIQWCYKVDPKLVDSDTEKFTAWCVSNPKKFKAFSVMTPEQVERKVAGLLTMYAGA